MTARGDTGAARPPLSGDHTGIEAIDDAADPHAALARFLRQDDAFHAAFARAGGHMLGASTTNTLHVFEAGRQVSRCGTVLRAGTTVSKHRTDVAAIEAGEKLCRVCCKDRDEIAAALAERRDR